MSWAVNQIGGVVTNTDDTSATDIRIMAADYDANDTIVVVYRVGPGARLAPGASTTLTRQQLDGEPSPSHFEVDAPAGIES